jgi:peptide/nickel transport system permease protein
MRRYLISRIGQNLLTFFLFLTMVFFLLDAQPGDFGNAFVSDPKLTAEQRAILRARLGLDKPVHERYLIWLANFAQGEFGISFSNYPRPVLDVIAERAPRTVVLFLSASLLSFFFGFNSGKILAWNRGGLLEYIATLGGVGLYTVFTPWFGLMMILLFAFTLKLFPIGKFIDPVLWRMAPAGITANFVFWRMLLTGFVVGVLLLVWSLYLRRLDPIRRKRLRGPGIIVIFVLVVVAWFVFSYAFASQNGWGGTPPQGLGAAFQYLLSFGALRFAVDILWHLILPITTLSLLNFAGQMLLTRNSMLETLREDYILTARAKGLPELVVRDKHAARNALLPVLTSFILGLAFVLDGGVITETIFSWPGMGLTLLSAAQTEDIPMAIGALVFTGTLALTAHLIADVLYAYLDPRIRYA